MTSPSADLLRVLYDPASWADSAWLARYGADARWPARLANRILLRRAPASRIRWVECDGARINWLVAHWDVLPDVAYIAGARLARDVIVSMNGLTRLRCNAGVFLTLPFSLPATQWATKGTHPPPGDERDIHALAAVRGAECLRSAMYGVADGWHDRISLRLPPLDASFSIPDLDPVRLASQQPASFRLLTFAASFNHAQNR